MAVYQHKKIKPKPVKINSLNYEHGLKLNELETALLVFQKLIDKQVESGKKGMVLFKGTESECRITYSEVQGILFELHSFFGLKGCFSFGICGNCENFGNSCTSTGTLGYCGGQEKHCFDTCSSHSIVGGGFGLR